MLFIIAVPKIKLFTWGKTDKVVRRVGGGAAACVFITAVPITKLLFAWRGRGIVKDMCYERRRAEACVD